MNDEVEIEGTFDSEDTAHEVARALNRWFAWIVEGDLEDVPELFEDFGVATDEYTLEDTDTDWEEHPRARVAGNMVIIRIENTEALDSVQELVETLGAYEVNINEDVEDLDRVVDDDDDEDDDSDDGGPSASSDDDDPAAGEEE